MPDNVLNAMRGLTEYLMRENQLQDIKEKEQKINTAAERIAEAYQSLPPSASIEDIQNLGFRAIEDAAALGTIQEVMPLINQMQSSTVQMYGLRKGEASSNAIREYIQSGTGQTLPKEISGAEAIQLTQLPNVLNPPTSYTSEKGMTYTRKYNLDGSVKSEELVNAFGAKEQMDIFKEQENVKLQNDITLANVRGAWQVKTASAGVVGNGAGGYDPSGFKLRQGWEGTNGEVLYTDAKGRGNYALQPDGTLVWYNGQIQKIDPETQKEKITSAKDIQSLLKDPKDAAFNALETLPNGVDLITAITGQEDISEGGTGNPTRPNVGTLYKAMDVQDWDKKVNKAINQYYEANKDELEKQGTTKNQLWDKVKTVKRLGYHEAKAIERALGLENSTSTVEKVKEAKLTIPEWNKGNQTIASLFQAPDDNMGKIAMQNYIGALTKMPGKAVTYNTYASLDSLTQAEVVKVAIKNPKKKN